MSSSSSAPTTSTHVAKTPKKKDLLDPAVLEQRKKEGEAKAKAAREKKLQGDPKLLAAQEKKDKKNKEKAEAKKKKPSETQNKESVTTENKEETKMVASKQEKTEEVKESKEEDDNCKVKVPKGTHDILPEEMVVREKAFRIIKNVFLRHGAVQIDTPVFELKETLMNKYGEDTKLIYELANQGGEILALRYDLTVPFARYMATHGTQNIKRFHIGRVYRRDQPIMTKGRFREFYQCDFDIAGYETAPVMLPDAEVIKVICEILSELEVGNFKVKFNHRKLLDAMMEIAGVPKDKFRAICSAIDKLDKTPWEQVEDEMIRVKGLEHKQTDILRSLICRANTSSSLSSSTASVSTPSTATITTSSSSPSSSTQSAWIVREPETPSTILALLKERKDLLKSKDAVLAIDQLEKLTSYLKDLDCLDCVVMDLSLARGLDYYTGVIYEAVMTDGSQVGSIGGGGRYDGLIGMFSGKNVPAVGVSVGIERIFTLLQQKEQLTGIRKNFTHVLVSSVGKNLLQERMKLAAEFWAAGIPAEIVYSENPKATKQFEFANECQIPYVVLIGEDELKKGVVSLKDMKTQIQVEVARKEIVATVIKTLPTLFKERMQLASVKKS
eukprot:TRINITY_DN8883_c0_g1_i1.p1 TRINITY_DN8883_c0_g1~~TRINITY_DN8883_c0_g1_i1.p1  ORF type:complete len:613 (+),score=170.51 TRINITY_DN8883_c0_g1_i1:92-1930(+)